MRKCVRTSVLGVALLLVSGLPLAAGPEDDPIKVGLSSDGNSADTV